VRRLDGWEMRRGGDGFLGEEWETWGAEGGFYFCFSSFPFSFPSLFYFPTISN
jgi:hypothetical protein